VVGEGGTSGEAALSHCPRVRHPLLLALSSQINATMAMCHKIERRLGL
jgi:hypothetical protein